MASIVGLNEVTLASSVGGLTVESIVGILVDTLHLTSALGIWGVERGSESGPYIGAAKGGNLDNLTLSNAFTVDLWARSDTAGNKFLISKEVGTGANGWAFYVDDSGRLTGYVFTDGISNAYTWTGRNRFSPDELWRHVALYYDDEGDRKVYLSVTGSWQKDTQVAANGNTVGDSDYDFIIGQRQDGSWRWDGAFSMVRVSRGDRFNHGVNFSPPSRDQILLPDEDTLYLWNFSDGEGNISEEIEGRTAIISGSATWVLDYGLGVLAGNVNLPTSALTLASSLEPLGVSPGVISQSLAALILVSSSESMNVFPGDVSKILDTLSLSSTLEALQLHSEVSIALSELSLSSSPENLILSPGSISTILSSLILSGAVESITVDAGVASVVLNTLSLAGSLEDSTVSPGTISIVLDDLVLSGSAQSTTLVPGGVSILVDTVTLVSSLESIDVFIGLAVVLQTMQLVSEAVNGSLAGGAISIPIDTLTITSTLEDILVSLIGLVTAGKVNISDAQINDIILADNLIESLQDYNVSVADLEVLDKTMDLLQDSDVSIDDLEILDGEV